MGPLSGITIIELAAIGPVPFCGQLLADLGAEVILIERADDTPGIRIRELSGRGRQTIAVDIKHTDGVEIVKRLVAVSDVLLEGFRPGVMERLGLGPEVCCELNPGLVYGRMTGWGQDGPMAQTAGHDINYLSMVGALEAIGPPEQPIPPLNLVADFGGGALFLALGVLAALVERSTSGRGQVIDAAMVDGAASLLDPYFTLDGLGSHDGPRGTNFLDGGAPFYRTYRTADDGWMAVGALEPQFYAALLTGLGLDDAGLPGQWETERWPELAESIGLAFATRGRDAWTEVFDGIDACVTPVLSRREAPLGNHAVDRGVFVGLGDATGAAPAPRFSRTAPEPPTPMRPVGADTEVVLRRLGYDDASIAELREAGRVR